MISFFSLVGPMVEMKRPSVDLDQIENSKRMKSVDGKYEQMQNACKQVMGEIGGCNFKEMSRSIDLEIGFCKEIPAIESKIPTKMIMAFIVGIIGLMHQINRKY